MTPSHADRPARCSYEGCTTKLSRYNSGRFCWPHERELARARFERREQAAYSAVPPTQALPFLRKT
jgi:hypothetical protein